jgi:uncharacterized membrane protein YjgN (DUF898 family)
VTPRCGAHLTPPFDVNPGSERQMNDTTLIQPPPLPPPLPGRTARGAFIGQRRDFFRLVRRGALLELMTAGFYRFWLATDIRRALWSGTVLEGDPAEYSGTAKELLIGFLFALAILVPIYLVYFLIGIEAERAKAFASIPLVLFFYAFGQFAIFRARRYRATRTVWRGVRFWMTGSGWDYSWRACLWGLLVIVTIGLALPWRDSALERFKMRHLHYGDLPGRFDATGGQLFKRGWLLWLLCICTMVLIGLVPRIAPPSSLVGIAILQVLVISIGAPFIYSFYKAITWRWWLSGIRFGEVRFESDLSRGALTGLYWAMIGWCLLILVVDIALIALIAFLMRMSGVNFSAAAMALLLRQHPYLIFGTYLLNYLVIALCANVALRVYLLRGVWERVVNSVTVHNLERADDVHARGDLVSALGEGFVDGLDVAGF